MSILTIYKNGAKKWDNWTDQWIQFEDFMKLFLSSLNKHNPTEQVYVKSLSVPEETKRMFLCLNPNVIFEDEPDRDVSGKDLWAFFREIEFKWWKSKLEAHPEQTFIHTDIDLLFRGSIEELYHLMASHDVGFPYDANAEDRSKYNKGIFAVRGEMGLEFIKDWEAASMRSYEGDREDGWYTTQLSVFHTLSQNKFKLLHFPRKYHDSNITPEGVIWHAHKTSKYEKLMMFQNDLKKLILL